MKASASALSNKELILALCAGNPGAINVLMGIFSIGRRDVVERLYELDICGPAIWVIFKDLGDQTIPTAIANIEREDLLARLAALDY